MPLDVDALRSSFELVIARSPQMTGRFYEVLFQQHPEARPLFAASLDAQQEMLTRTLALVIERVEDGVWLEETLRALGAKHVDYGVTAEMYPWVKRALLTTLAEVAAEEWTTRVEAAWSDALDAISRMMLGGARASAR